MCSIDFKEHRDLTYSKMKISYIFDVFLLGRCSNTCLPSELDFLVDWKGSSIKQNQYMYHDDAGTY